MYTSEIRVRLAENRPQKQVQERVREYISGKKEGITVKKQAYNPYLPSWEYIPDGEPYVFGDRVYVYGSHDRFGGYGYCQNDYVCWWMIWVTGDTRA